MDAINTNPQCQSCGMPLIREEDFGKNEDHTQNRDYCKFCFVNGEFTHPSFTVEDQIELVANTSVQKFGISFEQAQAMAKAMIPRLQRWKKSKKN